MLKYWLICFLIGFSAQSSWAESLSSEELLKFSNSPVWQKLYQYKNNQSKIKSQVFFLSQEGMLNPLKELEAAIVAFKKPELKYGTLMLPAACAFPARKAVLEKHLKIEFQKVLCPDLDAWIKRINANQVAISFAGSYMGNPASILGHTFLRYYQDDPTKQRHELLSHAVGFLAVSPPDDSRAMYMVRGLTGQYPGFYQIEPFYMKVGLYNNSESRDIWEQKLNLTPEEVQFSLKLLWEYSFNAEIPYYFIDENCSYRMLSFLEVVRPEANLVNMLSTVVLPADTVRVLIEENMASTEPHFKASILRKLDKRISSFSKEEKNIFEKAKKSPEDLAAVKDPKVLDGLIDYWTYTNYRAETKLKAPQALLMEQSFIQRSKISAVSVPLNDEDLRNEENLMPPYLAHKSSWITISGGRELIRSKSAEAYGKLSYRMGVHALNDDQRGYEDVAAIEYLGFDIESNGDWKVLLVDARSLESLDKPKKSWSWLAEVSVDSEEFYYDQETMFNLKGGGGGSYNLFQKGPNSIKLYFLPALKAELGKQSAVGAGVESGLIFKLSRHNINLSNESLWKEKGYFAISKIQYSWHMIINHSLLVEGVLKDYQLKNAIRLQSENASLGYRYHF